MSATEAWPGRETADFYGKLHALSSFAEATEGRRHVDVPQDWWIVIADVAGSTQAIEAGAYKKVNTVGVACIAAVANVDRSLELPFVFGGDGATFAIPEMLREPVIRALRGAQRLARRSFSLDLRVGLVSVADLVREGYWVRLAKVQLSPHVTQPALSGRGWEEAEKRVKQRGMPGALNVVETEGPASASFEGFECRWQGVPSFYDHKLSLLVAAISSDADANLVTYQRVLQKIQEIYGEVVHYHPLRASRMQLTLNPALLVHEWRVRSAGSGMRPRLRYFLRMVFQNIAGRILFVRNMDTATVRWSRYRDELVQNSDFRKFDGMLRMVMDGSEQQASGLQAFLEEEFRERRLVYGLHKSREALVTCIIQSHTGNHLHFVDGSDGGYALAARALKQRLASVLRIETLP